MRRVELIVAIAAVFGAGVPAMAQNAALEKNKTLAQQFHLEIIQKGNLDLADTIIAPDAEFHSPLSARTQLKGPERAKFSARNDRQSYPKGLTFTHDQILAEGNLVAFHWVLTGTRESGEQS